MRYLLLTAAAVSAATLPFAAQAETLADAVALAYSSNPTILAQRSTQQALDETLVQAKSGLAPTVNSSFSQSYLSTRANLGASSINNDGKNQAFGVTVSQPLFTGGRTAATVSVAKATIAAGQATLNDTEQQVLASVATAYTNVRRDMKLVQIALDNQAVLKQQLDDTQTRYNARNATGTDLAQAQSRYSTAQAGVASAQGSLEISRAAYLAAVGDNPRDLAPEPDLATPASLDEAISIAAKNNPALEASRLREVASDRAIAQAKTAFNPSLSLDIGANAGSLTQTSNDLNNQSVTARVTLSQPIFTAGLNASRVRQAERRNDADEALVNSQARATNQAVAQSWAQLASLRSFLALTQQAVNTLQLAYQDAQVELRAGTRTTLDVLNQAQELNIAQQNLASAQASEFSARIALLRAMGSLDLATLSPGEKPYDPNVSYKQADARFITPLQPLFRSVDELLYFLKQEPATPDPSLQLRPAIATTLPPAPPAN